MGLDDSDNSDEERIVYKSSNARDDHSPTSERSTDEGENEDSVVREGLDLSEIASMFAAQNQGQKQRKRPATRTSKGVKKVRVMKVIASKSTATRRGFETPVEGDAELPMSNETTSEAAPQGGSLADKQDDLVEIPAPMSHHPPATLGERTSEGWQPQGEKLANPPLHSMDLARREEILVLRSKRIRESQSAHALNALRWDEEKANSKEIDTLRVCHWVEKERLEESLQAEKDNASAKKKRLGEALTKERAKSELLTSQMEDLRRKCGNLASQVYDLLSDKDEQEAGIFDRVEKAVNDFKKSKDLEVYVVEDPVMKGFRL
ncbi:hypothetical protein NE237_017214 [Protea cynaroides]|uniref:Uncharacterized protein n=1 Tax=Protea cynaroides TaxID=273540 RepID=A0A9Q0QML4_9MAGN|nr:hypothetical protein NE237_017214 [Protea cynaroides]